MTWFTQTANQTEAAKNHCQMFLAVDIDLPSGHVRVFSGDGTVTINGNVYSGIGKLGTVGVVPDGTKLVAERKSYRLSGAEVNPELFPESDIDGSFGRSITEYFGFVDSSLQLIAAPEVNWEGRIDPINRSDGAEPFIEIQAKNRMALLDVPNGWRYTHEHQPQFFSGDDGFKLKPTVETAQIVWSGGVIKPGVVGRGAIAIIQRLTKA